MGLFGRLFGSRPDAPAPPANAVVIPDQLAGQLTAGGTPLSVAVLAACRAHVAPKPAPAEGESGAMPFWLDRSDPDAAPAAGRGDIEDELRDRVIERHSADGDG